MAWFFGDGFDLYALPADMYANASYWDSGSGGAANLYPGRFTGSRGLRCVNASGTYGVKSSGQNDNVHHINVAFIIPSTITAGTNGFFINFRDGTNYQCTVVFSVDGAIRFYSGSTAGTLIATYSGAVTAAALWAGFEIEVVIHNTAGSVAVRKNGNPVNDFSATALNTRAGSTNNYANRLEMGCTQINVDFAIDDFLWRSDSSSVAWAGDIRCHTRMPATDASVQWTPSGGIVPVSNFPEAATSNVTAQNTARYMPFVAPFDGTISSVSVQCVTAATASFKCCIYASAAGLPTTVIDNAGVVTNPGVGTLTWTFATPVPVTRGTTYFVGFCGSASSGSIGYTGGTLQTYFPLTNATVYASFPVANPTGLSTGFNYKLVINITPTGAVNAPFVADTQQDAAVSYVSSSTVGQIDLYGIAPIGSTPVGVLGVTTRTLAQKTDGGPRSLGLKVKSGATDVTGTSTPLNTIWGWVWRVDVNDPATSAPWTPVAVNNLQVGETVTL